MLVLDDKLKSISI